MLTNMKNITMQELFKVCLEAKVSLPTARKYFSGGPMRPAMEERIRTAVKVLKLPYPRPRMPKIEAYPRSSTRRPTKKPAKRQTKRA